MWLLCSVHYLGKCALIFFKIMPSNTIATGSKITLYKTVFSPGFFEWIIGGGGGGARKWEKC